MSLKPKSRDIELEESMEEAMEDGEDSVILVSSVKKSRRFTHTVEDTDSDG